MRICHSEVVISGATMMMACQQCGDEGLSIALVYCRNCRDSAVHRYCLPLLPENLRESVTWFCEDCVPKVGKQNPLYKPMPLLPRTNDFKRLRTVKGAQSVSRLKKTALNEVRSMLKRDINGTLLSKSRNDRTSCHNREVDCCENLEVHNNCRTHRELNGKSCPDVVVLVKTNSPQAAEDAEEALSEKTNSPQAAEEAVSEKTNGSQAVEEAVSDKTNGPQAVEEAVSEKTNSPHAAEEAVSEKTKSLHAAEEAVSEKINSLQAAEEAVSEKTNSPQAAEEAVSVKTNSPQAADCGDMGSLEQSRDVFYVENDNNGQKRRRCVGSDESVDDEPMVDVHCNETVEVNCNEIVKVHCDEMKEKDRRRSRGSLDRFSGEAQSVEAKLSLTSTSYQPNISKRTRFTRAEPLFPPIWNGSMKFCSGTYGNVGLVAHLSTLTLGTAKVVEEAKLLSELLCMEILPSLSVWPKSFESWGPIDGHIAIFIFPDSEKEEMVYDRLVEDMINNDLAMRTEVKNAELLVFTSKKLPSHYWRVQSKFYLWGVFRGKQTSHVSNAIIPSGGEIMSQQTVEVGGHTQYLRDMEVCHPWKRRHMDHSMWYGTARETWSVSRDTYVNYHDQVMSQHHVMNTMYGGNSMVFGGNLHQHGFEVPHQEAAKDSKQPPASRFHKKNHPQKGSMVFDGNLHQHEFEVPHQGAAKDSKQPPASRFHKKNHPQKGNGRCNVNNHPQKGNGRCNVHNESVAIKKRRGKRGGSKQAGKGNVDNNGAVVKRNKGGNVENGVVITKNKGGKGAGKVSNKAMVTCFRCGKLGHFAKECKLKWV